MKSNKGITLVALIITVVVMLILAGVAISAIVDGNGLFSKSRQAVGEYENASRKEADQMQALMNEIDKYLTGENGGEGTDTDTTAPTNVTITSSNIEGTTFTLTATGADGESGIAKYEFYLDGTLEKTIETTEGTAIYNVTGKTAEKDYKYKVRVYDKAGNYKDSSVISVTTIKAEPKIGDFVNYSVEVDGVTYEKWRILDFDNNGHMEIVCYNGPEFFLGELGSISITESKSDYANAIKILNDASVPYKNGKYGYGTRHLGSNPSNPSSYATIHLSYVKYYSDYNNITANAVYSYIVQTHDGSDRSAILSFSNTLDGKKLAGNYSWLASRNVNTRSSYSSFYVRNVNSSGTLSFSELYNATSDGRKNAFRASNALAPVVSLESGVKINTLLAGNGSEDSPWVLTK